MTVRGQRIRHPSTDQTSAKHEEAGHVLQMRSCHFILMASRWRNLQSTAIIRLYRAMGYLVVALIKI